MRIILAIVGGFALCSATVAAASEHAPQHRAAERLQRGDTTVSLDQRICVQQGAVTGSRISKKICRTYREWLREGIDPLAK